VVYEKQYYVCVTQLAFSTWSFSVAVCLPVFSLAVFVGGIPCAAVQINYAIIMLAFPTNLRTCVFLIGYFHSCLCSFVLPFNHLNSLLCLAEKRFQLFKSLASAWQT